MANWYYVKNGQKCGPVDTNALKHLAETGQLQPADLIWREGMGNWVPASQEEGLFEGGVPTAATAPSITPLMAQHLLATRPWVLFLSIMGFIGCGFMVLAGLGMIVFGGLGGSRPPEFAFPMAVFGLICLVLAGVYAVPAWLLLSYARAIQRYRHSASSRDMAAALGSQKSFWKFVGIMTVVVMSIYLVVGLIALVVSMVGMI